MALRENEEDRAAPVPDPKLEPVAYEPHGPHGLVGPIEPNYAQKDHVRGTESRLWHLISSVCSDLAKIIFINVASVALPTITLHHVQTALRRHHLFYARLFLYGKLLNPGVSLKLHSAMSIVAASCSAILHPGCTSLV